MPIVKHQLVREFADFNPTPVKDSEPSIADTFSAGFYLENDVQNYVRAINAPTFNPNPEFKLRETLETYDKENRTNFFSVYKDNFLGVESEEEMLFKINSIKEENAQRDILDRSGWTGYVASVTAGLASPLTFIPFVGAETRGAQIARMASMGFFTSSVSEYLLQNAQETRTAGESIIGITAGTALAGLLGGVIKVARPAERAVGEAEITQASQELGGLSAQRTAMRESGNLEPGVQTIDRVINKTGVLTNPVTQNINQEDLLSFRALTQQLSDSGLAMEGALEGRTATPGGTLENRIATYGGMLNSSVEQLDALYNKYFFEGAAPKAFGNIRAEIGGALSPNKLSKAQFYDEVSRATWEGYESAVPEVVAAAKMIASEVLEPIKQMAQKVGLLGENLEVVGDKAYLHRMYNVTAIQSKTAKFVNTLAANYEKQLQRQYAEELAKTSEKAAKATKSAEDMSQPAETARALKDNFENQLKLFNETQVPDAIKSLEQNIADTRSLASALAKNPQGLTKAELDKTLDIYKKIAKAEGSPYEINNLTATGIEKARKQLLADARDMETAGGADLKAVRERRRELRARIRDLSKANALLDEKRLKKLDYIEGQEDKSIASVESVVRKAESTLRVLDKWSDKKFNAEVDRLWKSFEDASIKFDRARDKVAKYETELGLDEVAPYVSEKELMDAAKKAAGIEAKLPGAQATMGKAQSRMEGVIAKLEAAEALPREEIRGAIREGLEILVDETVQLNAKRAQRIARVEKKVAELDPAVLAQKLDAAKKKPGKILREFESRWEGLGAMGVRVGEGAPDFSSAAIERATEVKDTIVGTYLRLPFIETLGTERGPELQRVLNIPSSEIAEFLERDVSKVVRTYVRTMAPDIEIYAKFGDMDWRNIIKPAVDELNAKLQKIDKVKEGEIAEAAGDAKKIERIEKKAMKETKELNDKYDLYKNNFIALIERLRNQRGLPADPDGFAYRGARMVMNLNVLRMMGMVTTASIPDAGRPIMRYGLTRTFRDGFLPLVTNLKAFKLNVREAKIANAANELTSHSRAMAIRDVVDDLQRGSKFERAVEYGTNRIGLVALFDYWTQGMKLLTSSVSNAKLMESLAVVNGAEGTLTPAQAIKFLAEQNIDDATAKLIWKEVVENGGGGKVDGVWWPNTESWKSADAKMAYRQALYREVSNTIISPGLERPLLSDTNTIGRMLYQFKSFGLSATPKIALAGLQQKDAAVLSGSLASLGLGALSYYIWAVATGGKAYEDMMNADLDKWADEAMQRSGLFAGLGEVQRIAQNIPLLADYASFSNTRSTRRPGDNLVEALMGPSFDFMQGAAAVVSGLKEPTQSTLHEFRKLVPFQNTMFLREAIDAVEDAIRPRLPERRN